MYFYVCVYIYIHTYMYTYIYIHIGTSIHTYAGIYSDVLHFWGVEVFHWIYSDVVHFWGVEVFLPHMRADTLVQTCIHTQVQTYIHTHTHTYIHTVLAYIHPLTVMYCSFGASRFSLHVSGHFLRKGETHKPHRQQAAWMWVFVCMYVSTCIWGHTLVYMWYVCINVCVRAVPHIDINKLCMNIYLYRQYIYIYIHIH